LDGLKTKYAHIGLFGLARYFSLKQDKDFFVVVAAVERVGNPKGVVQASCGQRAALSIRRGTSTATLVQ
jgi:hypothetical protein